LILLVSALLVVVGIVGYLVTQSKSGGSSSDAPVIKPLTSTTGAVKAGSHAASSAHHHHPEDDTLCPVSVFYGSQTGSAEGFSKQIVNEARKHGFKPKLVDLEDFDAETAFQRHNPAFPPVVLFVQATYGEGDPTDNASEFVKWLKDPVRCGACFAGCAPS
jgi:sulfite reductase alpha subunit-like flavoprotein